MKQPFIVTLLKQGEPSRVLRVFADDQEAANAKALRSNQGWTIGITMQRDRKRFTAAQRRKNDRPTRNELLIDCGYAAVAAEEGHYD